MEFSGEIIFAISDCKSLNIDFGFDFMPSKIIKAGDKIALGRSAIKNRWMHCVKFSGHEELIIKLEEMADILLIKINKLNEYKMIYNEVCIEIYIRSELAQIGYSMPTTLLKKIALLECPVNCSILSFGGAICETERED